MKVLHVIPAIAPRYGGPSQAVLDMCRGLKTLNIETVIVTTDHDGPGRLRVPLGELTTYQDVQCYFSSSHCGEGMKLANGLGAWFGAHAKEYAVFHIHSVFSHASWAASRAAWRHRVPYIVRPLGTLDPWSLRQKPWKKRLAMRVFFRRMLNRAGAIHYTSEGEKRLVESTLGLQRGWVVPLGIAASESEEADFRAAYTPLGSHPFVLFLSRLHPKKGIEILLQAFAEVSCEESLRDWRLVLAGEGDGNYIASIRKSITQQNLNDKVLLCGWISGGEKWAALREAELLVLPSFQENFGLCVMESLAMGRPAIISDQVNLWREVEQARAGWVVELTVSSLSCALREALNNASERRVRGEAGKRLVDERFRWPLVVRQLKEMYIKVASMNLYA